MGGTENFISGDTLLRWCGGSLPAPATTRAPSADPV